MVKNTFIDYFRLIASKKSFFKMIEKDFELQLTHKKINSLKKNKLLV